VTADSQLLHNHCGSRLHEVFHGGSGVARVFAARGGLKNYRPLFSVINLCRVYACKRTSFSQWPNTNDRLIKLIGSVVLIQGQYESLGGIALGDFHNFSIKMKHFEAYLN